VLSQVLAVAETYAPAKTINLLEVGGVQQVVLEVRVAEMSRTLLKRLGINFNYISDSGNNLGITMLNNLTELPAEGWPANPLLISDPVNAIFSFTHDRALWTTIIDALKENGVALNFTPTVATSRC